MQASRPDIPPEEDASVGSWLKKENTALLAANKQMRQELRQAENEANGGVDVDALRQKIARQQVRRQKL